MKAIKVEAYGWKKGSAVAADADEAAILFSEIRERDGDVTPHALIEASCHEQAVLHDEFEWDNDAAAGKYRLEQAEHVVRSFVVVYRRDDGELVETRGLVSRYVLASNADEDEDEDCRYRYIDVQTVMADDDLRGRYLRQALRELGVIRKKYNDLCELTGVFVAVDKALVEHADG